MRPRQTGGWRAISGLGLSLIGTTCCALPITLVALGAGGAVASMASAAPWLIMLSKYKLWTFAVTALVLGYGWWGLHRVSSCGIGEGGTVAWQKWVLGIATVLWLASVFAAYALPALA